MTFRARTLLPSLLLLGLGPAAGCADVDPSMIEPPPIEGDGPTYYEDIAPILTENCVGCHNGGGIAPFELETYEQVATAALLVKDATASRTMPPWGVDNSGDCNTYDEARWLSDDEIALIGRWVDDGAPMGDPANEPPGRTALSLDRVDATVDMGVEYVPDPTIADDYRCFVLDPELDTDKFLTGFEVHPGEPRIVHHIILFGLLDEEGDEQVEALDEAEEGPGYTCFGGAMVDSNVTSLAAWAPGVNVTEYPEGTGIRVPAGRKVVMQVHYNLAAGPMPDRTSIDLRLEDRVDREAFVFPMADINLYLPPREEYVETSAEIGLSVSPIPEIAVHGVFPHMHTLGRTLRLELDRAAGNTDCVADVPAWDFNWQQFYFYDEPMTFYSTDTLRIICGYDTMERNAPVTWGEGTQDEMCLAGFYATLP